MNEKEATTTEGIKTREGTDNKKKKMRKKKKQSSRA